MWSLTRWSASIHSFPKDGAIASKCPPGCTRHGARSLQRRFCRTGGKSWFTAASARRSARIVVQTEARCLQHLRSSTSRGRTPRGNWCRYRFLESAILWPLCKAASTFAEGSRTTEEHLSPPLCALTWTPMPLLRARQWQCVAPNSAWSPWPALCMCSEGLALSDMEHQHSAGGSVSTPSVGLGSHQLTWRRAGSFSQSPWH
mmetsp:Transcript_63590/g.127530  ORF Transcript_63590/g.127530 Transcript_63590/m.127530 type:complete len:202 (-) Transcript_63590:128-733(-)